MNTQCGREGAMNPVCTCLLPNPCTDHSSRDGQEELPLTPQSTVPEDAVYWELFHGAIIKHDERCWATLLTVFSGEVRTWCRRASGNRDINLEEAVSLTWQKFWYYYTADKLLTAS